MSLPFAVAHFRGGNGTIENPPDFGIFRSTPCRPARGALLPSFHRSFRLARIYRGKAKTDAGIDAHASSGYKPHGESEDPVASFCWYTSGNHQLPAQRGIMTSSMEVKSCVGVLITRSSALRNVLVVRRA